MNKEERKIFRNNTIKLIIGIILLSMSVVYLKNHPAERVSVWSGFSVMRQRVEIIANKVFTGDGDVLQKKYEYEKYIKELVKMAEGKKCLDVQTVKELNEKYNRLKDMSVDEFKKELPSYKRYLDGMNSIVTITCD